MMRNESHSPHIIKQILERVEDGLEQSQGVFRVQTGIKIIAETALAASNKPPRFDTRPSIIARMVVEP